jgi:hypothetical protein
MLYWLEIQDMALQAAGGKPGPEAAAAAEKLIATLPHSDVLTRFVLLQALLPGLCMHCLRYLHVTPCTVAGRAMSGLVWLMTAADNS